ncbi:MAG TPA: Ig-like domain-containing protein [Clostridia bacterium]|nr:Ig-like domain-containing protein [Clostridia bacterium]
MKKVIAIIMVVLFAFAAVPFGNAGNVVANAAEYSGTWGSNISWALSDSSGVLQVSGNGEMLESQTDYPWMQHEALIKTIIIKNGVTSIAEHAFSGCSNLANVIIDNSVLSIGNHAFEQSPSLTDVSLKEGLKIIGEKAFYSCRYYTEIVIPGSVDSIGSKAFGYVYFPPDTFVSAVYKPLGDDEYRRIDLVAHCYIPSAAFDYVQGNRLSYVELYDYSLDISQSTAEMLVGGTLQLSANIFPFITNYDNIYWDSENENIATVSENGLVTALQAGTVGICAIHQASGVSKYCQIIITYAPVTGVSLNYSSYDLNVGETVTLEPIFSPPDASDKSVTWTSNNTGVATVNEGTVTAVSAGTAEIIIQTVCGGFTANCTITVSQPVSGVSLNYNTCSLNLGDTLQLRQTVLPATASNKDVIWRSSDNNVASVVNGLVTANSAGTATITVETVDGNYTAVCTITVLGEASLQIVIDEEDVGSEIKYKVAWWKSYKNEKLSLGILAEGFDVEGAEIIWLSDNKKVVVDQNGVVNNTGALARSANIKVVALDENGNIIASDEVKVIIYRFSIELLWVK